MKDEGRLTATLTQGGMEAVMRVAAIFNPALLSNSSHPSSLIPHPYPREES
ncbi:MAG: hypothetical protein KME43_11155 [Myxacorys chilensis ATA2-1-KO14]|jgi:hypothetical protein|nr:hypothetical protein [Myxacorys chilensis ATA2-1-KO14]